jgi:uncharacterized protein (DUF2267 family)
MTTTGIDSIDKTLHKTNEWLAGISAALEVDDRKVSYTALRAVLHALRDRLPLASVVGLAAQLPMLVRGIYYDGWQPEKGPAHVRSVDEFLGLIERDLPPGMHLDAEDAARAVFRVMDVHLDANETVKIIHLLPRPIQDLWRGPVEPRDT